MIKNNQLFFSSKTLPEVKEKALIQLLEDSPIPLKRDDLYQKLWGKPVQDKKEAA